MAMLRTLTFPAGANPLNPLRLAEGTAGLRQIAGLSRRHVPDAWRRPGFRDGQMHETGDTVSITEYGDIATQYLSDAGPERHGSGCSETC